MDVCQKATFILKMFFFYFIFCVTPVSSPGLDLNPKCLIIPKLVKKNPLKST